MLNRNSGFTLIELVMVIVILGILAVVAVPRFIDLRQDAMEAAEQGVIGAVRGGIQIAHAKNIVNSGFNVATSIGWSDNGYPLELDNAPDTVNANVNALFGYILEQGITDSRWNKVTDTNYRYYYNTTNNVNYNYDTTNGTFEIAP